MEKQYQQDDVYIVDNQLEYGGFFQLRRLTLKHKLFNGQWSESFQRELCVRGDAVGVLLYDPQLEKFALVEQLRTGVIGRNQSPWLLELVAGMLDKKGENCEDLVRREAVEEAGLEILALEPVMNYFCSPGGSTEFISLFCGRVNLQGVSGGMFGLPSENEDIKLHILSVDEAMDKLDQGQVNNAMTIIALQWFQLNRSRLMTIWPCE